MDGVCSQSTKPLELITLLGTVLSFLAFFAALFYFAWYFLVVRNPPQGFTTLVILLLLSTSIQTAFIGLLGESHRKYDFEFLFTVYRTDFSQHQAYTSTYHRPTYRARANA